MWVLFLNFPWPFLSKILAITKVNSDPIRSQNLIKLHFESRENEINLNIKITLQYLFWLGLDLKKIVKEHNKTKPSWQNLKQNKHT